MKKKQYIHAGHVQEKKNPNSDHDLIDHLQQAIFTQGFFMIIFLVNHKTVFTIVALMYQEKTAVLMMVRKQNFSAEKFISLS